MLIPVDVMKAVVNEAKGKNLSNTLLKMLIKHAGKDC